MRLRQDGVLTDEIIEYLTAIRVFGTEAQQAVVDALSKHRDYDEASKELQVGRNTMFQRLTRLKRKALARGYAPEHDMKHTVAEGFGVKGVSSYYGKDGKLRGQWVKTKKEETDRLNSLMDAIAPLAEDVAGKSKFVEPPKHNDEDLLTIYPMGDPHIGLHAWAKETSDRNFNLKLAKRNQLEAVNRLVALAPPSETAVVLNLGDFFHTDSGKNATTYGTPVSVDGRIAKVLKVGVDIMVDTITAALSKHKRVFVYCLIGNHDDLMSVVLAVCLQHHFNNNPRVTVETDPKQHHFFEFGANLIGMHHGHTTKANMLPAVMASDMPEAWGRTKYRRFYCGHVHHETVKEWPGCTVETFRTLAPADAWHAGKGYRSGNDMKVDVWHKKYGHVNRHIVGIEAILDAVGTEDD